ncbi:MAG: ribonuclease P protein component [Chloroflexota bacterium]
MQRKFRLTRSDDFKRVRQSGKSYAHPLLVLVAQAAEPPRVRVGVTAGRTVGNAVQRNRAKRLLREAMRPSLPFLPPGWDLILIARPGAVRATLEEVRAALAALLRRASLLPSHES